MKCSCDIEINDIYMSEIFLLAISIQGLAGGRTVFLIALCLKCFILSAIPLDPRISVMSFPTISSI